MLLNLNFSINQSKEEKKMSTDADNMFSEDDEVVYDSVMALTKTLSENLHLFNYPIRHNGCISQDSKCLSARIKPKQQRVELEFGIDVDASSYDTSRGEQIAYNVDGQSSNGECYFNSGIMDKVLLVGTKVLDSDQNYALGFMRKGELHLTPLQSIIEMNPGYVHMDKIDNLTKSSLNENGNEGEEEEAVAVTMRFEGSNAERDRQIRQKSYQYFQQKNSRESWVNLNYHKRGSVQSITECEKLLYSQVHQDVSSTVVAKEDYLKELVPECLRLSGCQTSKDEDTAVLPEKPLSDQIRHLMINAHLLTFSMLAEKISHNVDTLSIERLLQQIGVLVQGCWAVKSELLYAENSVSPHTGVGAKQLINARDYILWLFTKTRFITRQDILSAIQILDDDFKAIIIPLAYKTNRGWEFKFPTDEEFLENHPSIQQSQDIKWNLRYNKLVKDLKMSELEEDPPRPRQKRLSHSSISEGDESGTDSGTSKDRNRRANNSKKRTPLSPTKLTSKPRLATLDISPTYLESSPPESLKQELQELVGGVLRSHFCMTFTEIRDYVLMGPLSSVANRTDFEALVDDALNDYGAQKLKNKWPQNTTPENLYAFAKFGNKLDRYRAALLDLFSTTARTRANLFVKKVEDEFRERISEADCRQIFEEYCVYKSGFYYLKGTIALES